ncbi:ABC transporter ATP-binding protein [Vallitalea okinawensis]|uniref:ABC transporter ATP-binding protein n=1 Tax=Vallitalea okinawensis TaxID=2078660 RepID=UPI000CFCF7DD|nr:ABC transporter ATP-binding protein [Vallitalea okinawensis]
MKPLLSIKNLSMNYHTLRGETPALRNISMDVHKGEFISIVGPSGCGKSTLLSLIAGLLDSSRGTIELNDSQITNHSHPIGYMFQKDHLFDWRTIESNAKIGLEIQKMKTDEYLSYIETLMKDYGLDDFRNHYPSQLSGGMRQRAALIRTLALQPEILLLDEPFSALDYQTRLRLSDDVWKILKKEKKTALLVTHDISEAVSMSDRVYILSERPATIKKVVSIQFEIDEPSPIAFRSIPKFQTYFHTIWEELNET